MVTGSIKISKIRNNPPGLDRLPDGTYINLGEEFVEIRNTSNSDIDISSWSIEDAEKPTITGATKKKIVYKFVFPFGTKIKANSVLRLRTGKGKTTGTDIYWNYRKPIWNNKEDVAVLRDAASNEIDKFEVKSGPIRSAAVEGFVYDKNTNDTLTNGVVSVVGGGSTNTDDTGYYYLSIAPKVPHALTAITTDGKYKPAPANIPALKRGEVKPLNFYLQPLVRAKLDNWNLPKKADWGEKFTIDLGFKNNGVFEISEWMYKLHEKENNQNWNENAGEDFSNKPKAVGASWTVKIEKEKRWGWYNIIGLAFKGETKKTFAYKIWHGGRRRAFNFWEYEELNNLSNVVVEVSKHKQDALDDYNNTFLAIAAVTTLASALTGGLLGVVVAVGGTIIAATDLYEIQKVMDDPAEFDKNFRKKLNLKMKFRLSTKFRKVLRTQKSLVSVAKSAYYVTKLHDAIDITKNRIYSAHMKNNKNAIALQKRNLIIFTNKYEKNLNKIKAWVRKNKKSLLINFTKENYDKVRQKLLQGKPKKLVSFLKSLDFSDEKIGNVLRVIKKYGYKKVRIGLEQFLNKHNKILTSAKPR